MDIENWTNCQKERSNTAIDAVTLLINKTRKKLSINSADRHLKKNAQTVKLFLKSRKDQLSIISADKHFLKWTKSQQEQSDAGIDAVTS